MKNEIFEWVQETADRLKAGADLDEELPVLVDYVARHLDLLYADCEPEASVEGAALREAMHESIELYHRSLECLETYLEQANPKLLGLAVRSAREATDLLRLVRSRIPR